MTQEGNGFPEISILIPLCEELKISVNELLSGQRLLEEDYKKKAEENMVNFVREKEENAKKMQLTVVVGVMSTVTFITLLMIVTAYTEVISLPVKLLLIAIACGIFAVGMYVAMQGERTIGYYKCKHCGDTFIPTFAEYTFAMHMITTRYMKCPHCGKKSWCKKILAKEE